MMDASIHRALDEARALEHTDVPRDGGERQGKWFGELGHHRGRLGEASEQLAARLVAERAKDEIELPWTRKGLAAGSALASSSASWHG